MNIDYILTLIAPLSILDVSILTRATHGLLSWGPVS